MIVLQMIISLIKVEMYMPCMETITNQANCVYNLK
jgi:hypothetical protein